MDKVLEFKWTTSKGRDTYGYNICSLYVDGKKVTSCNGGGYDMKGTCLGEFIKMQFLEDLKKLPANYGSGDNHRGFYGLVFYNPKTGNRKPEFEEGFKVSLDGACGFSSMERVLNAIGYKIKYISQSKNRSMYLLTSN